MATRPASRDEFQIAIVCALPIEYDAVALLVDEFWSVHGDQYGRTEGDPNTYATGRIGAFNIVLVLLANTGKNSAAGMAAHLRHSYTRLDLVLLTGICGVVPGSDAGAEIFLGDVVISTAIVQYDLGRLYADGFVTKDTLDDRLPRPNKDLRNLLATLKTDLVHDQLEQRTAQFLRDLQEKAYIKRLGAKYRHPGLTQDKLFQPHYTHRHHLPSARCVCRHFSGGSDPVCDESRHLLCDEVGCDDAHLVQRHRRKVPLQPEIEGQLSGVLCPSIIIGRFGSGDSVMKSGDERDAIARRHGLVAFEMEGAGLWDEVPCILVKAACDYADSHKNKQWQGFAAAAAAAAMRALLERVMRTSKVVEASSSLSAAARGQERPFAGYGANSRGSNDDCLPDVAQLASQLAELKTQTAVLELSEADRIALVQYLSFPEIDARLMNLILAEKKTCEWFLRTPVYTAWQGTSKVAQQRGLLWIKGKPGAGKSVLMKFLLSEERSKVRVGDRLVISFFFNAQGVDLEKSALGLYRSLLSQLFQVAPDVQSALGWLTHHNAQQLLRQGWKLEPLKQSIRESIKRLGDRTLCILVDALDECSGDDIQDMVNFFEEIGAAAADAQKKLQICFSSRHYPNILVNAGLRIVLEAEPGHDNGITLFIKSNLRMGDSPTRRALECAILKKSSNIFLWVALVVRLLNQEYSRGRVHELEARLAEIPAGLDALFAMIVHRDTENWEDFRLCLLVLLYAYRPLKPEELWFAIHLAKDLKTSTRWDENVICREDMVRFANDSSKGLAELTRAGNIQLIHESVRDFLLHEKSRRTLWPEFWENLAGWGNDILKECCEAQIKNCRNRDHNEYLTNFEKRSKLFITGRPFLEYATTHIFGHSNRAQRENIPQHQFINQFPVATWVLLNSYFNPKATNAPVMLFNPFWA